MTSETHHDRAARLTAEAIVKDARIAELIAQVDNLLRAREHAGVIEQAKGVLMSTMGCSPDAAFAALVVQSQHENRKLYEVAADLAKAQDRHPERN